MNDYSDEVKKAHGGDAEAVNIVVMLRPKGAGKGMSDGEYVNKMATDEDFASRVYSASRPNGGGEMEEDEEGPDEKDPRKLLGGLNPSRMCELHDKGIIEIKDHELLERLRGDGNVGESGGAGDDDDLLPDFEKRRDMSDMD